MSEDLSDENYEGWMIERLNRTHVTVDEILEVVGAVQSRKKDDMDWEGRVFTIMRLYPGDPDKAQSLLFRIEALARLIDREGDTGWTLRLPSGAINTQESVFKAAGLEPLMRIGNELEFERESFFKKVLELDELDMIG